MLQEKNLQGLSEKQVLESRAKHGANILTPPERDPWWKLFLANFEDPVIRILMIAAALSIGIGVIHNNYTEGIGIFVAIILATGVAFINEYKANSEFDVLNKVNDEVPIKAIREGNFLSVQRKDLVVDDIIMVEMGEEIPADAEVVQSVNFQIDEAKLTGESNPAKKYSEDKITKKTEPYAQNLALRGTIVADGHAHLRITKVGDATEIGQTAQVAAEDTDNITPLNKQLNKLSKLIGVVGFGVATAIFVALFVRSIITQEIQMTTAQWFLTKITIASITLSLTMVWLPILYDAFELMKLRFKPPRFLEGGWKAWFSFFLFGSILWGVSTYFLWQNGSIDPDPAKWIPLDTITKLLMFFMIAVTVIVVAVPEGLALSVTLSLAYNMRKMIASNNLVRRLHACETIGAATTICTDKTGTLTMNQMRVGEEHFLFRSSSDNIKETDLLSLSCAINSTANLQKKEDGTSSVLGNPTEGALLLWLESRKADYQKIRGSNSILKQWTFTTERKYMATIAKVKELGNPVLLVKGAPEILLSRSKLCKEKEGEKAFSEKGPWEEKLKSCQNRAMRTIGFAYKSLPKGNEFENAKADELCQDLTWLGFVAISDPVREDVPQSIQTCLNAGIDIKIVTGDNAETAKEVARQAHLWTDEDDSMPDRIITGGDFEKWSPEEVQAKVEGIKILARARPANKIALVKALQKKNKVVAVTGDGTNDAPALNHADVGLAMGKTGTSIAKEASDIILLDDSFTSLTKGILWGRSLYQNIQRFLIFQLTINVAALGIVLLGPFIGVEIPLTVMQMLWVNLIMDTFAALALATEPPNEKLMQRPPRDPKDFIIDKSMAKLIFGGGIIFIIVMVVMILSYLGDNPDKEKLTIFFTTFVFLQFWNMFNAKAYETGKSAFRGFFENKAFFGVALLIFVGQVVIVQFGGEVFRTTPLELMDWVQIVGFTSIILWIGEIGRFIKK